MGETLQHLPAITAYIFYAELLEANKGRLKPLAYEKSRKAVDVLLAAAAASAADNPILLTVHFIKRLQVGVIYLWDIHQRFAEPV